MTHKAMTHIALDLSERPRSQPQRRPATAQPARAASATGRQAAAGGMGGAILQRMARRPMRAALQASMLGAGVFIVLNALVFQSARHPAPWGSGIMSQARLNTPHLDKASLDIAPLPPSRPVQIGSGQPGGVTASLPSASTASTAPKAASLAREATKEAAKDMARESGKSSQPRADYALSGMQSAPIPPAPLKTASPQMRDPIGDLIRSNEPMRAAAAAKANAPKTKSE